MSSRASSSPPSPKHSSATTAAASNTIHVAYLDIAETGLRPEPDITWHQGGRCQAVLDAKYKSLVEKSTMPNADAYQMLAYCIALGLPRGFLIYAKDAGERPRNHTIKRHGYQIAVPDVEPEQVALRLGRPGEQDRSAGLALRQVVEPTTWSQEARSSFSYLGAQELLHASLRDRETKQLDPAVDLDDSDRRLRLSQRGEHGTAHGAELQLPVSRPIRRTGAGRCLASSPVATSAEEQRLH
jgi:McrBC 5-methylcytosine restriction system component